MRTKIGLDLLANLWSGILKALDVSRAKVLLHGSKLFLAANRNFFRTRYTHCRKFYVTLLGENETNIDWPHLSKGHETKIKSYVSKNGNQFLV